MGTRSLTYVYDETGKVIIKMYLQFDGYPSGHGLDLAKFLISLNFEGYGDEDDQDNKEEVSLKYISMERLAGNIVSHFFRTQPEYAMLVSPFCQYYFCQEWEYHIYSDKVKIVGDEKEYEADWRSDEFKDLCEKL